MSGGYYNAQGKYVLSKEEFVQLVLREQKKRKVEREFLEKEAKRKERLERIKKNREKSKLNKEQKIIPKEVIYKVVENELKGGNRQLGFVFE